MKRSIYLLPIFIFSAITVFAQRPPRLSSPDVHPDHSITFRYYSKDAQKVGANPQYWPYPYG